MRVYVRIHTDSRGRALSAQSRRNRTPDAPSTLGRSRWPGTPERLLKQNSARLHEPVVPFVCLTLLCLVARDNLRVSHGPHLESGHLLGVCAVVGER